jgi:ATP-dependent DNA helicase RecG
VSLGKLGLHSRLDFVLHLPLRYEDETVLTPPQAAPVGQPVQIQAQVQRAEVAYHPRRQLVVHAEGVVLRFFNFYPSQLKQFQRAAQEGKAVRAFGEVRAGWFGAEMAHPRYRIVAEDEPLPDALTPVYPTSAGIKQAELRRRILEALDAGPLDDTLPQALLDEYKLPGFAQSIGLLHRPRPGAHMESAWQRVRFDELLAQQLSMRLAYRERRSLRAICLPGNGALRGFIEQLPFKLTCAQIRAMNEVLDDIGRPQPMHRLLQGDVGSGKTVVAIIACLAAVVAGCQAAVMAPTEILAEQHWRKFSEWLKPLGVRIAWLHGGLSASEKKEVLKRMKAGEAQLIVGTHALVQEGVEFERLALAVVDEQHRFGVGQRLMLRRKAEQVWPHHLMMSATPIPRTLSMTYYADLDVSVIDELPPGRRPVATKLASAARRGEVLARIREACGEGQQAYWVCPVIEESKNGDIQTAVDTYEKLKGELNAVRVGLLHGRMAPGEKAALMEDFSQNRIGLLVCTTVIEVGVDVPNASLMVIESAERFGLAQLHQLRGRVGRGARESACILLYGSPLSGNARERLKVIYEESDGFEIARRDLQLRGPGEYLGERQSGQPLLRFADLERDFAWVEAARDAAERLIAEQPAVARAHVARWLGAREELTHA